jgi:polysaccharide pyruvyl transferase WcaK-like protein
MRVGIIGDYGFGHKDFDAHLKTKLDLLKQHGVKDLRVFSPQPYIAHLCDLQTLEQSFHFVFPLEDKENRIRLIETAFRLYYACMDYESRRQHLQPNEQKALDVLKEIDVLAITNTGIIDVRSTYSFLVLLFPCLLAKILGTKVVIAGQGFTPLDDYLLTPFLTYILNVSDKIITRDRYKQGLENINVDLSKVNFTSEDALDSTVVSMILDLAKGGSNND